MSTHYNIYTFHPYYNVSLLLTCLCQSSLVGFQLVGYSD
jgi:hypothetical protein